MGQARGKYQRMWMNLKKYVEVGSDCWLWRGPLSFGYGRFYVGGKTFRAYRFVYELLKGPIPQGMQLDHLCRNRACVNPDHLEPVTNRVNVLRGIGITAINAKKTICSHGHEFTAENTGHRPCGRRFCRICQRYNYREAKRRIRARRREEHKNASS